MEALRLLLLPSWQDSDPGHWQTRWEQHHGAHRVQQDDWWWPRRGDWMARLDEVLLADERRAILIGHSLGCQLVAAWAAHSGQLARVHAALLVAPPDVERADMPPQLQAWSPVPRRRLPFQAVAVLSDDDPYCSIDRGRQMATDWGCRIIERQAAGHLNTASGLGDWPEGWALVQALADAPRSLHGHPVR
jgi:uncharacterized protein